MSLELRDKAIEMVLANEGGETVDRAGLTRYGVTQMGLSAWIHYDPGCPIRNVSEVTLDLAVSFYRWLWEFHRMDRIPEGFAPKLFDASVNMGFYQAVKLAQRACRSCGHAITDDGFIGPVTLSALAECPLESLLAAFRSECAGFYRLLAKLSPADYGYALGGLLNRAYR